MCDTSSVHKHSGSEHVDSPKELTLRGVLVGAVVTAVFMAANVYMGLKTGLTFSSSIPAVVIAMVLFKLLGGGESLEINIVQTQASAAGTLCNINLVLPGLLSIGFWNGFSPLPTIAIALLGGLLGVAFSVPLRRVMVACSDLPFPEGAAAAQVLHEADEARRSGGAGSLPVLGIGAAAAAALSLATSGFKIAAEGLSGSVAIGGAVFTGGLGFSLAMTGVGYLVGLGACVALLVGAAIAWEVAVPVLTALRPAGGGVAAATEVWSSEVRLIGAGIIAVGALWTVATLVKPLAAVFRGASVRGERDGEPVERTERDIPLPVVAALVAAITVPLAAAVWVFLPPGGPLAPTLAFLAASVAFVLVFGFLMATACGYMAGLLGSSSSPISGIGILTVLIVATAVESLGPRLLPGFDERHLGAVTLGLTAMIVTVSSIANDNLQDLKTGLIVGATPWRQQVALIIGVAIGALAIWPVLEILFQAYGIAGAFPRPGMDPANALPAPQAALMTQITKGIVQGGLPWRFVAIGAGLGSLFVVIETVLRRRGRSFPALTVGIGMYLPLQVVTAIALGGVVGWLAERAGADGDHTAAEARRQRGVLLASGFLVGESLVGIVLAASNLMSRGSDGLALHLESPTLTGLVGVAAFGCGLAYLWRTVAGAPGRAAPRPVKTGAGTG